MTAAVRRKAGGFFLEAAMDWEEGMDLGGEEPTEDYCTSVACTDHGTCALYRAGAPVTPISEKIRASHCGLCPFFEPMPGRFPDALCHPLVRWPDHEEDRQRWALSWFLEWRKTIKFLLLNGDDAHFIQPVPFPDLWNALGGRMREWAWLEQGGLDLVTMQRLLIDREQIRAEGRPSLENPNGKQPQQSISDRKRGEGPRAKGAPVRRDPRQFFRGNDRNVEGRGRAEAIPD